VFSEPPEFSLQAALAAEAAESLAVMTRLPEMSFSGFVSVLLNDQPVQASAQTAGSVAVAVCPKALASALAPETLYHFTRATGHSGIVGSGQLIPGMGVTGFGVYGTAVTNAATITWAGVPADAMVRFSPGLSSVGWGLIPGLWWRVTPAVTTLFSYGVPIIP
jgi:hypothetical protein